jgi:hypothetical protein
MGSVHQTGTEVPELLFYVVVALVAAQAVGLAALAWVFSRQLRRANAAPSPAAPTHPAAPTGGDLEDVLLLHRSGLLLKHYTLRLRPNMDSDVLSGMLVAVQEFIKDSFRQEGGTLDEIRFGGRCIKVLEGKWTLIAALVRGEATESHKSQMRAALKDLETRYEDLLIDWDGTMDRIPEVDRIMMRLVEGGYAQPGASPAAA